jgi:alpha-beta hydrolase superfamily lysophospholipase
MLMPDDHQPSDYAGMTPSRTDYTVAKGEVSLAVYRKALDRAPRPLLFLVHGSSNSALSSFDLEVPGGGEYSTMNAFARLGFDTWTMDHENYGRSSRTSGNSDIASGVADLVAATALVSAKPVSSGCISWANPRVRCAPPRSRWRARSASIGWC